MKQLVLPPGSRSGGWVELKDREHLYLARVRRIAVGERLTALDSNEKLILEVTGVDARRTLLRVIDNDAAAEPPATRVVLFPFLLKARKLDDVVRQACEAGVSAIVPVVGDVHPPVPSRKLVAVWDQPGPLLFFHQTPLNQGSLHRYLFPRPDAVGLVVGPEGGLASDEVQVFLAHGAKPVWLGPSVLRAETASLYAVAAVNTILQETPEWTIPL